MSRYLKLVIAILLFLITGSYTLASNDASEDLKSLNRKAESLLGSNPDEVIKISKKVLSLASEPENSQEKADALKYLGVAHYYKQNNRQSLEYYEQALSIYKKLNDKKGIAAILNNTGLLFERQGDYATALKRYNQASLLFSETGNKEKLTASLSNTGNLYSLLGRYDLSLDYMSQALRIAESLSDSVRIANAYNNVGNIYLSLKDYHSAEKYFHDAEKINEVMHAEDRLIGVYNNLGLTYLGMNRINEALKYNQLSMELAKKVNDIDGVITNLINIGEIYFEVKDYTLANINYKEALRLSDVKRDKITHAMILLDMGQLRVAQEEFDEAIICFKEAQSLLEKTGSNPLLQDLYKGFSEAHEAKGNFKSAFDYLKKHDDIADSIYNSDNLNRFNMIRVSFEMEQTERDNQLLRQQNIYSQLALKRQQIIRNLSIMISAIVIVFSIFLFLMYYSKKKKNILLAQRNNQITTQKAELDKLYLEQFKLNEIKNKFFSIIAHDLKSPFQSLLGFSELLSEEYEHFSDKQRIDAINNIYKVTTDTYQLIENLLEWGRIQTGSHNAFPKVINMKDIVNEVLPVLEIPLKNKELKLETDIPEILLANADPNMISAVLRNLISNAIKFSNAGEVINIKGYIKDNMVVMSVIDHGIGMAPDVVDKLFTFNPKVRRVGTRGETGTGMGLGLCHEFMSLNNGVIKVKSQPGKGSTFTMFMQTASQVQIHNERVSAKAAVH